MNGWNDACVEYFETGKIEQCPFCGSNNVKVEVHIHPVRDSYFFTCTACGQFAHYDGVSKKAATNSKMN